MNLFKKIIPVSLLITALMITPLYGKSVSELQKEQEKIKSNANTTMQQLKDTQEQKSEVLAEVDALDAELTQVTEELDFIISELDNTKELLTNTEADLGKAVEDRETQYEVLKKRIRFMYENGNVGYLQIAFRASDLSDFLTRIEYINRIVKYDNELSAKLQSTEDLISLKKEEIEKQKREIEVLAYQQENKKQSLEETVSRKYELVNNLSNDEQQYLQQVKDLEDADRKIEKLIKDAQAEAARKAAAAATASTGTYTGGKIGWPVPSSTRITSPFGNRIHPISKKKEFHTGIDIGAAQGTNIVASEKGTVISSGWMGGYGYTVIVDHGNGLSTLYAHNSKLLVSVGQTVTKGQTISKAGSTGYSTGPHLHFEVRINGQTKNPVDYVGSKK